ALFTVTTCGKKVRLGALRLSTGAGALVNLVTNAFPKPAKTGCNAFTTGKSGALVEPAATMSPEESTAMPNPSSVPKPLAPPPRKVERINCEPDGFSSETKASPDPA